MTLAELFGERRAAHSPLPTLGTARTLAAPGGAAPHASAATRPALPSPRPAGTYRRRRTALSGRRAPLPGRRPPASRALGRHPRSGLAPAASRSRSRPSVLLSRHSVPSPPPVSRRPDDAPPPRPQRRPNGATRRRRGACAAFSRERRLRRPALACRRPDPRRPSAPRPSPPRPSPPGGGGGGAGQWRRAATRGRWGSGARRRLRHWRSEMPPDGGLGLRLR